MKTLYRILAIIYVWCALVLLTNCTPSKKLERKLRRADRYAQKHNLKIVDTVTKVDTVRIQVPLVEHDTAFVETLLTDTVYIEKERLKIKMWKEFDTIHVKGKCDSLIVTQIREVKVPVTKYITHTPIYKRWWFWVILIAFGILVYISARYEKKR